MLNHLEALYHDYNRREFVHPDPLECLYRFDSPDDLEIAGLVASALAYGKVAQILKSVYRFLNIAGPRPASYIDHANQKDFISQFAGFRHRFAGGDHMASLLSGIKGVREEYGSLYDCFISGMEKQDSSILPAMTRFTDRLLAHACGTPGHLLASPGRGSACKRLNLFLRWMVRKDSVDLGIWDTIPASALIVPLDVHMHRIGCNMGLTTRKQANMRAALDLTGQFRRLNPDDPVKYDFALTRFALHPALSAANDPFNCIGRKENTHTGEKREPKAG